MNDEVKFTCLACKKQFDPDPNTMFECDVYEKADDFGDKDLIGKTGACVCLDCQEKANNLQPPS